jgi:hypothetical protein
VRPTAQNQHDPARPRSAVAARIGVAFVVAAGLLLAAATALAIRPGGLGAAQGAALLLAGLVAFYATSRTTGIPLLEPRAEPLDAVGATTKLVEALGLVFALRLSRPVGDRRSPLTQEAAR